MTAVVHSVSFETAFYAPPAKPAEGAYSVCLVLPRVRVCACVCVCGHHPCSINIKLVLAKTKEMLSERYLKKDLACQLQTWFVD